MPLYLMLCITAHYKDFKHIKELVRLSATHVMDAGGVVRGINSWGTMTLPQRMKRHGNFHYIGDYWTLHFDTAPRTLRTFNLIMRRDPRVIRWTVLKMGEKLEDVAKEGEKATKNDHTSISSIVD